MSIRPLIIAMAAVLGALAPPQEKELVFEGPPDATPSQLIQAAKALAARCEAYDLKKVTGIFTSKDPKDPKVPRRVRLTCPSGFPEGKRPAVDFLASFAAAKVQLRVAHRLSLDEEEKFRAPDAAPKGAVWVEYWDWGRADDPFQHYTKSAKPEFKLLKEKPVFDATGKLQILRHAGGTYMDQRLDAGAYIQFPKDITKALYAAVTDNPNKPGRAALFVELIIDGCRLETGGGSMWWIVDSPDRRDNTPDIALWSIKEISESKVLPFLLKHPLPFALKRSE